LKLRQSLAAALLLVLGAAAPAGAVSDLELTWRNAQSAVPDMIGGGIASITDSSRRVLLEESGRKFAVVVYMHGCTGLKGEDRALMRRIAKAGYVVVAPNSMARKFRPLQCNTYNRQGGDSYYVFDFRQEEINFAARELFKTGWADTENLFLFGVSEGGLAAAHYRGPIFKARVITQWTCHGSTWVRGISGPEDTPILSVVRRNDPWYKDSPGQAGDCGAYYGDKRPGSESIVLEKGDKHEVINDEEVIGRIIAFFNRYRTTPEPAPVQRGRNADVIPLR